MKKERSFRKPSHFWDWVFAALFTVLLYSMFLSWWEANTIAERFRKSLEQAQEVDLGETNISK